MSVILFLCLSKRAKPIGLKFLRKYKLKFAPRWDYRNDFITWNINELYHTSGCATTKFKQLLVVVFQ